MGGRMNAWVNFESESLSRIGVFKVEMVRGASVFLQAGFAKLQGTTVTCLQRLSIGALQSVSAEDPRACCLAAQLTCAF
jgi:hypothetical protein